MKDLWQQGTITWMKGLAPEEIERLRRESSQRNYDRGATIFSPEVHPHSLYLLESGLARIYRLSDDGDETSFGYVAPGEVFGELTVFGDYPRESFAVAVHPSRVWKMPIQHFQRILETRPAVSLAITRQIGQRMKRIESRVETLVFRDVRSRVAGILLELAEDFGKAQGEQLILDINLTQSELATLVGSTRQTVNASLGELESAGLLERQGRSLLLIKPSELARVARAKAGSG
jgi:CRP-like cAMP-binding protein